MQFNQMNLIPKLVETVTKYGYKNPTPIQETTIPITLAGKDILGCAQTGTGKTAAFALPILQHISLLNENKPTNTFREIKALVLAPTRELAVQNFEAFQQFGKPLSIRTTVILGGVNQKRQVASLQKGVDILVATPGRLNDLIRQNLITLNKVEIFVLDEADRMLDMGFVHDVKAIIKQMPKKRQNLLFSATMPKEVESLALSLLNNPETVKIDPVSSTVDKIEQSIYYLKKTDKDKLLLQLLNEKGVSTALVFTRTKHNADQVVKLLLKNKIKSMAIHGNKSQNARQNALNSFKSGKISVLVATDIAARGIDISELPFVINYHVPEEAETYIHRIGRTGRAGLGGTAITMCCDEELSNWRAIERLTKKTVPISTCPWSVEDMEKGPAKNRYSRGSRNHRNGRKNPGSYSKSRSTQKDKSPRSAYKKSAPANKI